MLTKYSNVKKVYVSVHASHLRSTMCSSFVGSEKTRKKETIFLAKFSIDNMSGPGKWRLWQKLAPQERCVLRRDEGSFENLEAQVVMWWA